VLDYILHTAPDGIKLNTDRATDEQDEYKSTKVSVSTPTSMYKKHFQFWTAKGNVISLFPLLTMPKWLYPAVRRCSMIAKKK
jgi:hypothetical protein